MKIDKSLIEIVALSKGLDPALVMAIVKKESDFRVKVTRYEPTVHIRSLHMVTPDIFAKELGISLNTEKVAQAHSYGLMQVMGFNFRARNFRGYFCDALEPKFNLETGCTILKELLEKYSLEKAISSYNQGSPIIDKRSGVLKNYDNYVAPVLTYMEEFKR